MAEHTKDLRTRCYEFVEAQACGEWDDKTTTEDADKLVDFVTAEVAAVSSSTRELLLKLVRHAFNLGLTSGMKEYTSSKGGNTWVEHKPDLEQRLAAALSLSGADGQSGGQRS